MTTTLGFGRAAVLAAAWCGAAAGLSAQTIPAGADSAVARLNASPRHGEWVTFDAGSGDSVRAWVSFPERRDRAGVVVLIHEIFGLSDWVRGVADQLAADGFIAVAPDLLSGKGPGGGGTESVDQQGAVALIRALAPNEVARRLAAASSYGTSLPAARRAVATIGYCWGGGVSFRAATFMPDVRGAVVYYGASPDSATLGRVSVPVLGLYGGDDARVNATIEPARARLAALGRRYETELFEGAGHGFLRNQAGQNGANLAAAQRAWPRTVAFLREVLGR